MLSRTNRACTTGNTPKLPKVKKWLTHWVPQKKKNVPGESAAHSEAVSPLLLDSQTNAPTHTKVRYQYQTPQMTPTQPHVSYLLPFLSFAFLLLLGDLWLRLLVTVFRFGCERDQSEQPNQNRPIRTDQSEQPKAQLLLKHLVVQHCPEDQR